MIVVDTSVWIAAARQPSVLAALQDLIEADDVALALPVKLELLAGVSRQQRADLGRQLDALALLVPTEETWAPLPAWIERAADAGDRFAIVNLLIASLTQEIGGLVWSLDQDFERMERLQLVSRYVP